jgi:hypothetical protein
MPKPNRIKSVAMSNTRLDPLQAEVRIEVVAEKVTERTELHGNLVGPRCISTTTIEIAYPMLEESRTSLSITVRVIIPEPSLWDAETPFVYEGRLILSENGHPVDSVEISHALRHCREGK